MNVEAPVVIPVLVFLPALKALVASAEEKRLATPDPRLLAYELLARPDILAYNHVLRGAQGEVYVRQDRPVPPPSPGSPSMHTKIVRAPMLDAVRVALRYTPDYWQTQEGALSVLRDLLLTHPPQQCCWFSPRQRKACPLPCSRMEQHSSFYGFCGKHWPLVWAKRETDWDEAGEPIRAPSATAEDDFLDAVI